MPRKEHNNPTERIGRLLEDIEELSLHCDELREIIIDAGLAVRLPPAPLLRNVEGEKLRRELTLTQVKSSRLAVRRSRYRQALGIHVRGSKPYDEAHDEDIMKNAGLTEETKREIAKLMEEENE